MRLERKTASSTECVTNNAVKGCRSRRRRSSSLSRWRVISSSAPKGSSSSSSCGVMASARARETRIFMPPESCRGNCSEAECSPTNSSSWPARAACSAAGRPRSRNGSRMFCSAVSQGNRVASWKMKACNSRVSSGSRPAIVSSPPVTGLSPETRRSRVDLPQPLGPMSVTKSPCRMDRLMRSSTSGPSP